MFREQDYGVNPMQRSRYTLGHVLLSSIMLALATLACSLVSNTADDTPATVQNAPLVVLLAPVNKSTFAVGAEVALYAIAQDEQGRIARLEFRVDDIPAGMVNGVDPQGQIALTGQVTWAAEDVRKHIVTVEAVRADGLSLGVSDVVITVVEPPIAGVVSGSPAVNPGDAPAVPMTPADEIPTAPTDNPVPQTDLGILTGPPARVISSTLNLRQGPGTGFPPVGELQQGDMIQIVGRNADSTWWAVLFRGGTAWVFAELVRPEGDTSQVPLVATPGS